MNVLPFEKRRQILHLMVEGNGINAITLWDVGEIVKLIEAYEMAEAA